MSNISKHGPFRSWLFTPGNHPRRVEKALDRVEKVLGLSADAVILDLEDAVAVAEKPTTRAIVDQARRTLALIQRIEAKG